MAGRPREFDEKDVIDKAIKVFWEKGYEGTMDLDLMTAMGIGKSSYYLIFKGKKKEIFEKSLRQFSTRFYTDFKAAIAKSDDPVQYIRNFFLQLTDESDRKQAQGCYLGNGLIETSTNDPQLKKIITRLMEQMADIFTEEIRRAQAAKQLKTKEKPEVLGRYLLNLWNGINITRRMYPKDASLKEEIKLTLKVLE